MSNNEIWICARKRVCGWRGKYEDLAGVPSPDLIPGATIQVCPRCGHDAFYHKAGDAGTPYPVERFIVSNCQKIRDFWQAAILCDGRIYAYGASEDSKVQAIVVANDVVRALNAQMKIK